MAVVAYLNSKTGTFEIISQDGEFALIDGCVPIALAESIERWVVAGQPQSPLDLLEPASSPLKGKS